MQLSLTIIIKFEHQTGPDRTGIEDCEECPEPIKDRIQTYPLHYVSKTGWRGVFSDPHLGKSRDNKGLVAMLRFSVVPS
ncbi:hypothetical protein J6590_027900 [Homalodisca vitripennis]|nr:hypothetical protein J6590_027900 [Homalodisca vitripennis]